MRPQSEQSSRNFDFDVILEQHTANAPYKDIIKVFIFFLLFLLFNITHRAVVKKSIRDPISIHAEKARDRSKNVWIDLFQVTKGTIFFDAQGAPIKSECRVNETET